MWIHEFFIENFPQFQESAYFVYYILDIVGIITFFKLIFAMPSIFLGGYDRD